MNEESDPKKKLELQAKIVEDFFVTLYFAQHLSAPIEYEEMSP